MEAWARKSFTSVFINCPFTEDYASLFEALAFTVLACGFCPRSALEKGDSGEIRVEKITRLIKASPLSIHDLSAIGLDPVNQLPRFNMPFELGLTLGLKAAGGQYAGHTALVLEHHKYTSQKCLSDIAGQDLQAHGGSVDQIILRVRNWLRTEVGRDLPGPRQIRTDLQSFRVALARSCDKTGLSPADVPFSELVSMQLQFLATGNNAL
jgi:hypothetical protein